MITGELKSKVDRIWDTMWSGGISNPLAVIEQLTYLLFIKRLDELHMLKERKAARTGHPIEEPVFTTRQGALRWSRFKELAPERMFETVRDRVFPFIKSLGQTGDSDAGSTYTHHMKDALFMMPTARVLANVVDQLDDIDMADRDTKGDLYEYMLGKIATAGQNGQFRTPRHIIRLMVDMTAPTPKDVICDPEPDLVARTRRYPFGFPGGVAGRQGPRPAGPVLAPPLDDDRQLAVGHVPAGHHHSRTAVADAPSAPARPFGLAAGYRWRPHQMRPPIVGPPGRAGEPSPAGERTRPVLAAAGAPPLPDSRRRGQPAALPARRRGSRSPTSGRGGAVMVAVVSAAATGDRADTS